MAAQEQHAQKQHVQLVSVFDTSITDNNLGNQIIMEAVNEQLEQLFPQAFFIRLPYLDSIGTESCRYVQESEHAFLGGTNALTSEMENYRQWGLDSSNCQQLPGVVLMGVGWWQYQGEISAYTRDILQAVLHPDRLHSVRDAYTREKLRSIGFDNVLVTGCPSMWHLTRDHCRRIPKEKGRDVLLTFTNYNQAASDEALFRTLKAHYRQVHVWVQGPEDRAYAQKICGDNATLLDPNLRSLDRLLAAHPSLDYVGTRLHAGIRALGFGRRSLVIAIDNRATEMGRDFDLPVLDRGSLEQLPERIEAGRETSLRLPQAAIDSWRQQFRSAPEANPLEPVSRSFAFDRGQPIDRHYIEGFLETNRASIRGRVLEVADDGYARRFGSEVTQVDILNAEPSPTATLVGDLCTAGTLPANTFDCIILTQTLNVLPDPRQAIQNAVEALAPNGTLLITVPGISQISRYDMDRWGDYWRFTDRSLRGLLEDSLGPDGIHVMSHGNVAVAKAFLDGMAVHEIDPTLLEHNDIDYQVLLTARAVKSAVKSPVTDHSVLQPMVRPDAQPVVLLYHRVAENPIDPQLLAVTPTNFADQMQALAEHHRVVPLSTLLAAAEGGNCPPSMVALTFDDGYADVLENAVPVLERLGLHATVFVTSGMVGGTREFWWDALERILLAGAPLPPFLSMVQDGQQAERATSTPAQRVALHDELCTAIRILPPAQVAEVIDDLYRWAGIEAGRPTHQVVTAEQLQRLAASPAIEIGAHSVSHPSLATLTPAEQQREIQGSRDQLEALLNQPVRYFAYPYGGADDFDADTIRLVQAAGFEAGIANIQGRIQMPLDPYAVPRRLVRNWTGSSFSAWLQSADMGLLERETVAQHREVAHA